MSTFASFYPFPHPLFIPSAHRRLGVRCDTPCLVPFGSLDFGLRYGIGWSSCKSQCNSQELARYEVASATLLLWDMALTFELELRRVWFAPKTLGTTLFILPNSCHTRLQICKSCALILSANYLIRVDSSCKGYQIASTILQLVSIAIVESVLVMRTNALYQNKRLFILLIGLCFISMVNMLALFLALLHFEILNSSNVFGVRGCISACVHAICRPLFIGFWVPFLFFETLVFFLTIWKSYASFETYRRAQRAGRDTLVDVIIRDGLIYFVVIMAVSLCNFLIWITDPFASYLAVGLLKSLQATICSRMLLNLRGMLERQRPGTTATGVQFTQTHSVDLDNLRPLTTSMNLDGSHTYNNHIKVQSTSAALRLKGDHGAKQGHYSLNPNLRTPRGNGFETSEASSTRGRVIPP
ncbi:hypothetical protein BJ165DRAFT_1597042 [Panaeolus papilionaceus]|nr:hypothetical protein BJ165DRAFT_1597042 [Panaeolus papilionaceus]